MAAPTGERAGGVGLTEDTSQSSHPATSGPQCVHTSTSACTLLKALAAGPCISTLPCCFVFCVSYLFTNAGVTMGLEYAALCFM